MTEEQELESKEGRDPGEPESKGSMEMRRRRHCKECKNEMQEVNEKETGRQRKRRESSVFRRLLFRIQVLHHPSLISL